MLYTGCRVCDECLVTLECGIPWCVGVVLVEWGGCCVAMEDAQTRSVLMSWRRDFALHFQVLTVAHMGTHALGIMSLWNWVHSYCVCVRLCVRARVCGLCVCTCMHMCVCTYMFVCVSECLGNDVADLSLEISLRRERLCQGEIRMYTTSTANSKPVYHYGMTTNSAYYSSYYR